MNILQYVFFLFVSPISTGGHYCSEVVLIRSYIESTLEADLYYTEEFAHDDIRKPTIWLMPERIPIDQIDFNLDISTKDEVKQVIFPKQNSLRSDANYLLFCSEVYDNRILVVLLNNRYQAFNVPGGKTLYETWSRMNGGMAYLFTFNENGCIIHVMKRYTFNG